MSDEREIPFDQLPAWARAFQTASPKKPATSIAEVKGQAAWPLLVDAAVVSTFMPSALAPDPVVSPRHELERTVLKFAEPTVDPSGLRWSLNQEARHAVVKLARETGDLQDALDRTASTFPDTISAALRGYLRGERAETTDSLDTLEARRIAVGLLAGIEGVAVPPVDRLDGEVLLRRQLDRFERMVGQVRSAAAGRVDHFVGRRSELERLRRYVGVLGAGSFGMALGRGLYNVAGAVSSWRALAVTGLGGSGKTTLIAKFMLEHARVAGSRFPFAYIDFDRPTISARDIAGLLAEIATQIAGQFPDICGEMFDLRDRIREAGRRLEGSPESELSSPLEAYAREFRSLLDAHLDRLESRFEWSRPFLLAFDTFEVVQYSRDDEIALEQFVRILATDGRGAWRRLRVVISGRRPVARFVTAPETLEVGSLEQDDAAEMLGTLAADAGKPISATDARQLVAAMVAIDPQEKTRLKPQRIGLVGRQFALSKEPDGRRVIVALVDDLTRQPTHEGSATRMLIDAILIRRTLVNVADDRVRALADPGLVVRQITPEVIRDVMTQETPKPMPGSADPGDPAVVDPWIVDAAEARAIFDALAREITLVDAEGSNALRHRQDVRQEMLPLIRVRRPRRFGALSRRACDYFRRAADENPLDEVASAEAVYHGLWAGEPLVALDKYWRRTSTFDPKIDPDEFERGSLQDVYVRAKTRGSLAPHDIERLPTDVALDWVSAKKDDFLKERRPAATLATIRAVAGHDFGRVSVSADTAAVTARLLFRNGEWQAAMAVVKPFLTSSHGGVDDPTVLSLFRTFATLAGKSAVSADDLTFAADVAEGVSDPLVRAEAFAHVIIGRRAMLGRRMDDELPARLRQAASEVPVSAWLREARCLRLALLAAPDLPPSLMQTYLQLTEQLPHDTMVVPALFRIFSNVYAGETQKPSAVETLGRIQDSDGPLAADALVDVDRCWTRDRNRFLDAVAKQPELKAEFRWLIVFQHFDWTTPLGNAMTRAAEQRPSLLGDLQKRGQTQWLPRRSTDVSIDGVGVVQASADVGRLRDLASTLAAENRSPETEYPHDAFALADALLRWHRAIVERQDRLA